MATNKDISQKSISKSSNFRLRDLDKDILSRKIKEIEDYDRQHYRKTCTFHKQPKRKARKYDGDLFALHGSSSDESVEYYNCQPYKLGALGLIRVMEPRRRVPRSSPPTVRLAPAGRTFDWPSALILSDLGLLNKFEKKGKDAYAKAQKQIQENRRFYA